MGKKNKSQPQIRIYSADNEAMFRYLDDHLPNFLRLFDPTGKELDQIGYSFDERFEYYRQQLAIRDSFKIENCMIDLIWRAKEHALDAVKYLKFIDEQCKTIVECVDRSLWQGFKNALREMFLNHDDTQSRMKSYVGEICVAAKLCSENRFKLLAIEEKLDNGKSIDFKFEDEDDGKVFYVEVDNIEVLPDRISAQSDIKAFLEGRATKKLSEKFAGTDLSKLNVILTQVVWGRVADLDKFIEEFRNQELYKGLLSPLMIVAQLTNPKTDGLQYSFLTVRDYLAKVVDGRVIAGRG